MNALARTALRRGGGMLVVMFFVATMVFAIAHVIPGDPAAVMLGPSASAADVAALRTRLGLDAPLLVQYRAISWPTPCGWISGSPCSSTRALPRALLSRAGVTLQLTLLAAMLRHPASACRSACSSALRRGRWLDQAVTAVAMTAASLPSFWIGLTLIEYCRSG